MTQAPAHGGGPGPGRSAQRQHILDIALTLMSQRGVDGTSMRDLAGAAGLNVASLYHYFPSKRDLLVAVLEERGVIEGMADAQPTFVASDEAQGLTLLIDEILNSMLDVEDFVRLMLGEALRGDETAHAVGVELFTAAQDFLERWLRDADPAICAEVGSAALARMLRATLVGLFVEHVTGVLEDGEDAPAAFHQRAAEIAAVLQAHG